MKTLKHLISGSVAALVVVAGLAYAQTTPEPTPVPQTTPATEPMAPATPPGATSPAQSEAMASADMPAKADRN